MTRWFAWKSLESRRWSPALPLARLLFLVSFLGLASSISTGQELTTERLIGKAVSDIGPRYNDIDQAIQRFRYQDIAGARRFLELALEANPQLPPVDVLLAKMFISSRNSAGAACVAGKGDHR